MDETWLYHYDTETKQQSMERLTPPQTSQVQKPAGKVLTSIFWDEDSILRTDYLPKGQTINAEYYNYPAHQALATQKKLAYLGFQCLDHPPYSPELAPSDYHLFPGLKKQLKGCHFSSDTEVTDAVETWLDGQPSELFLSGLQKLDQRAKKCIEICGEYVE